MKIYIYVFFFFFESLDKILQHTRWRQGHSAQKKKKMETRTADFICLLLLTMVMTFLTLI